MLEKLFLNYGFLMMVLSTTCVADNSCDQGVAEITALEGQVMLYRTGNKISIPAQPDQLICANDSIKTAFNGKVLLLLNNETVLKMSENSQLFFSSEKVSQ